MKQSIIISVLGVFQLILAFSHQIYILNIFGIGNDLDIFFASSTINLIIVAISANAINFAFTPLFVMYWKQEDINSLKKLASSLFNIIFLLFLLLAGIQFLFAEEIANLILPGFNAEEISTTSQLLKLFGFVSIFTILNALLQSLFYTFEKFYATIYISIAGILLQLVIVYFLHDRLGLHSLILAVFLNQLLVFSLLASFLVKYYRLKILWDRELKNAVNNILPLIISSTFSKSNIVVDRFFASTVAAGSITLLQYGQQIVRTISSFLNRGISLVSLRKFSFYADDIISFDKLFNYVNKVIMFVTIPLVFAMFFFFDDTLKIILFSNKISPEEVNKLFFVVISLVGIFIGGNLNSILTNAFYARHLTSVVSKINVMTQLTGIVLKILLFYVFGFFGLPIAFSATSILTVLVLYFLYNKHIYKIKFKYLIRYGLKIVVIAFVATFIPKVLSEYFLQVWYWRVLVQWPLFFLIFILLAYNLEKDISQNIYDKLITKIKSI